MSFLKFLAAVPLQLVAFFLNLTLWWVFMQGCTWLGKALGPKQVYSFFFYSLLKKFYHSTLGHQHIVGLSVPCLLHNLKQKPMACGAYFRHSWPKTKNNVGRFALSATPNFEGASSFQNIGRSVCLSLAVIKTFNDKAVMILFALGEHFHNYVKGNSINLPYEHF